MKIKFFNRKNEADSKKAAGKGYKIASFFAVLTVVAGAFGYRMLQTSATLTTGAAAGEMLGWYDWSDVTNPVPSYSMRLLNNAGGAVLPFSLDVPTGIAIDTVRHRLFASDYNNNRVLVFNLNEDNTLPDRVADNVIGRATFQASNDPGSASAALSKPMGLAYDADNDRLFVADSGYNRVQVFDTATITNYEPSAYILGQTGEFASATTTNATTLYHPRGVAYDPTDKRLYVADTMHGRVVVFDVRPNGSSSQSLCGVSTTGIATGMSASCVLGLPAFGSGVNTTAAQNSLEFPVSVAFDDAGDRLFVADANDHRVLVYSTASLSNGKNASNVLCQPNYTDQAAGGPNQNRCNRPTAVAYQPSTGHLFVLDNTSNRVLMFDVRASGSPSESPCGTSTTGIANGMNASCVIGQTIYGSATEAVSDVKLSLHNNGLTGINSVWTAALAVDDVSGALYSAATRSKVHRYELSSLAIGMAATDAIGSLDVNVSPLSSEPAFNKTYTHNYYRSQLIAPRDVVIDPVHHRMFVSDDTRVLVYDLDDNDNFPDYEPDYIIGRPDFNVDATNDSNAATTAAQNLISRQVHGLAFDPVEQRLFVADGFYNRVLVFDVRPPGSESQSQCGTSTTGLENNMNASCVLGQGNFTASGPALTRAGMSQPQGLAYDHNTGRLYVADAGYARVKVYDARPSGSGSQSLCGLSTAGLANGMNASCVIGKADFTTSGGSVSATNIASVQRLALDLEGNRLFVGEPGSHRISVFDVSSPATGQASSAVLGSSSTSTAGPNTVTQSSTRAANGLAYDPTSHRLFVVQGTSNRVSVFDVESITNGEDATAVLGQNAFTASGTGTTASTMSTPLGVFYSASNGKLLVTDSVNRRILVFSDETPAATLLSLSPSSKDAGSDTFTLTVNGANFTDSSVIRWAGEDLTTTYVSPTQLTASIADTRLLSGGSVNVTVYNPPPNGGQSSPKVFSITNPVPTTTSISPTSKVAGEGNFTLTVNGTNFNESSVVRIGGTPRVTTYVSPTQVTAAVLAADIVSSGNKTVIVTNPTPGGGDSNSQTLSVENPVPTVSSTSPTSVPVGSGNTLVTVTGTNFVNGAVVRVEGDDRSTTFVNSTTLTFTLLSGDAATIGSRAITVFNPTPGGGLSDEYSFTISDASPVISSLSPTSFAAGTTGAADNLTVNGSNFAADAVVRVNGSPRDTTFVNGNQLTAHVTTSDMSTGGELTITVHNTAANLTSDGETLTIYNPTGTTTSISPTSRNAGQSSFAITVNGTGFINGATVLFDGEERVTSFVNSTQLTATITADDQLDGGTFDIAVRNASPVVADTNAQTFTVNNLVPTTNSISPTSRTSGSGITTLSVFGTNFVPSSVVSVDATDLITTYVSPTQLTATLTSGLQTTAGTRSVTVTNPAPGGGTSNGQTLTINNPTGTNSSLSPSSKSVGEAGFTLTVNGSNFVNGAVVKWAGSPRSTTFVNSNQLTATILTSDLQTAGTFNVTVSNPSPTAGDSNAQPFSVNNPSPTTTSISPTTKELYDDTFTLTVNGTNFVAASVVRFDGEDRPTAFVSATELTAEISSSDVSVSGSHTITVFTPTPGGGTSNGQTLTVNNPVPHIDELDPGSVHEDTGAFTLNVIGSGFALGATVRWNGSDRDTTFLAHNWLQAEILESDVASPGTRNVTVFNPTPAGGISDAAIFTVINAAATTCSPTSGNNVTISTSCHFSAGTYNFTGTLNISGSGTVVTLATSTLGSGISLGSANVTVNSGATLQVNGTAGATVGGTLTIASGATMTHGDNSASLANHLEMTAANITVQNGGTVSAVALGYDVGMGPGSGNAAGSGGAHGGKGGGNSDATYGSITAPVTMGSGGYAGGGAHGGGAIHLVTAGTLTLDGEILADASDWDAIGGSTGSGGSIWIEAGVLLGDGAISARGGDDDAGSNAGAGGGGGRIALHYGIDGSSLISGNRVSARGGYSSYSDGSRNGGAGTVFYKNTGAPRGSLLIWNSIPTVYTSNSISNATQISSSIELDGLYFYEEGVLQQTGGTITVHGEMAASSVFASGNKYVIQSGTLNLSNAVALVSSEPLAVINTGTIVLPEIANFERVNLTSTSGAVTGTGADLALTTSTWTVGSTFPNLNSLTLNDEGSLAFSDFTQRTIGALTVNSGGVLTHTASTYPSVVGIRLATTTTTVNAGGVINANGLGFTYASCAGNHGCGGDAAGGGAGGGAHYGAGGTGGGTGGAGGAAYDKGALPANLPGSPGGRNAFVTSGAGGGLIALSVSSTFTNDGTITANGLTGGSSGGGGGGTVNINAGTASFAGNGVIQANGGSVNTAGSGCGGGGRVYVTYASKTYSGTQAAEGGSTNCSGARIGAAGSTQAVSNLSISSLSPDSKQINSGAFTLTVNGIGFAEDAVVRWNGANRATTFVNSTQLTASILASDLNAAGIIPVTVHNVAANDTSAAADFTVTGFAAPTTTDIDPDTKTVGDSGFSITVTGTNFVAGNSVVRINGVNRSTTYVSPTQLVASILAGDLTTAGLYSITVFVGTPGGGESNAQTLTVINPEPTTTGISPAIKTVGSAQFILTVTGTNFVNGSTVRWNGASRTTTYVSPTQLTAVIPATDMIVAGANTVTVFNGTPGGGESNGQTLTVNNPIPVTSSISPTTKTAGDAEFTLTVNGSNFVNGATVRWSGSDRSTTYISPTQLTAVIPSTDITISGDFAVTVFNPAPGGGVSNVQTLTVEGAVIVTTNPTMPFTYEHTMVTADVPNLPAGLTSIEIFLDGTDPEDLLTTCAFSGAPTSGTCTHRLSPMARGQYTVYAKAYGADASVSTGSDDLTVQTATTQNRVVLSRIKVSEIAEVELTYTLGGTAFEPLIVTFPDEFQVLGEFTQLPACARGSSFQGQNMIVDVVGCTGTLTFGGGLVVNPPVAGTYKITWTDDEGEGSVIIVEADGITVTASVDPYITFDVGAQDPGDACDGTFVSSEYVISLGTLTSSDVTTSDAGGIKHVCTRLWTNATSGAVVTVQSQNGGLASASVPSDVIPSNSDTMAAGTANYGLCFGSDVGDSGTDVTVPVGADPTPASPFDGGCTPALHTVGGLTVSPQTLWSLDNPSQNAFAKLYVKAAASGTTPAHTDYSDILTFIATGTF